MGGSEEGRVRGEKCKGETDPQTPEVLENWAEKEQKKCKGVIWFVCEEKYVFLLWIL